MVTIRVAKVTIVTLLSITIVSTLISLPVRISLLNYLHLHPTHDRSMTTEQVSSGKMSYTALVVLQTIILGSAIFGTLRHRFVLKLVCFFMSMIWCINLVIDGMSAMDITVLILTIVSNVCLLLYTVIIRRKEMKTMSDVGHDQFEEEEEVYEDGQLPQVY